LLYAMANPVPEDCARGLIEFNKNVVFDSYTISNTRFINHTGRLQLTNLVLSQIVGHVVN